MSKPRALATVLVSLLLPGPACEPAAGTARGPAAGSDGGDPAAPTATPPRGPEATAPDAAPGVRALPEAGPPAGDARAGGDRAPAGDAGAPGAAAFGATPHAGGTTFRVWAPHATRVWVAGDWNGFSQEADQLADEPGGVFAGTVAAARVGHQYQYVIENGGRKILRSDPRARAVTSSIGRSLIVDPASYRWTTSTFKRPPPAERVIYELHIGTFNDLPGRATGTWRTAAEKLDYLAALGVNMLEVMPPAEFPGDYSWGYNPSFPFAPERTYGTPDDMKAFIDKAHALGIGVIIDVVHNHWGPNDLPMWCFDGECLGAGGVYFYTDGRRQTDWGPRPDYGRREVRDYIRDNALAWLTEYRADGLRWDSTINIRQHRGADLPDGWRLLQAVNEAIDRVAPGTLQIAEDFRANAWITRPVDAGGAGFDAQPDGGFFHPLHAALVTPDDGARNMYAVRDAIANRLGASAFERIVYTENHDEVANGKRRLPDMINPADPAGTVARKRSTLGAAIVLTAPGLPMLFMGQELLEDKWFSDTRPLDWTKAETHAGVLALYRDLVALRRNAAGKTRGLLGENVNVFHVNNAAKVIAYHRWHAGGAGDDVVVVANFSNRAFASYVVGLPRAGTWRARLSTDDRRYGADFGGLGGEDVTATATPRDGLGQSGGVALGPYSAVILSP